MFFGISHKRGFDLREQHHFYGPDTYLTQRSNRFSKSQEQSVKRTYSSNFSHGNDRRYDRGHNYDTSQDSIVSNRILHHREKKQRVKEQQEKDIPPEYSISVDEIKLLKDEVLNSLTKADLDEVCACKARYTYYSGWKGHSQAMKYSRRKPPKVSKSFKCEPCDSYSNSKEVHQAHMNSKQHHQINLIYTQLKKLAADWLEEKHNLDHKSKPSTLITEKDGLVISSENTLRDEFFESDSWLHDIESLSNYSAERFIVAALEVRLKTIWPQPKSRYYCRMCNHAEYASKELFERHIRSARHLDFERHFEEAFCVTCQIHNGDKEGMRKHLASNKHRQIYEILEDTKAHAISFWEKRREKRIQEDIPSQDRVSIHSIKKFDEFLNKRSASPVKEMSLSNVDTAKKILGLKRSSSQTIGIVSPMVTSNPVVASEAPILVSSHSVAQSTTITNVEEETPPMVVVSETPIISSVTQTTTITNVKNKTPPIVFPLESPPSEIESKFSPTKIENKVTPSKSVETSTKSELQDPDYIDCKEGYFKRKDIDEEKTQKNSFDEFLVPLTGFMCTICHQTLDNDVEVTTHMYSYQHQQNKGHRTNQSSTDSCIL